MYTLVERRMNSAGSGYNDCKQFMQALLVLTVNIINVLLKCACICEKMGFRGVKVNLKKYIKGH